ncbi:hypothetical protein AB0M92_24080 [Streptomyces sp. NPDC051582]|uniref:hypothetical protein n=1 Tax=Streptomyces sp. NPDC051582 TaxID=3155167 RepID=UPI0034241D68
MSGADGEGGYSGGGNSGPNSSDGSELPPLDIAICESICTGEGIARFVEGVLEVTHVVGEVVHWIAERGVTPIIVIPREELKKLVPDGA